MKYLVGAAVVILALSTYGALQLGPPPHLPHMTNAERIDLSRPLPKRQFATINAALDGCRNSNGGSQINQVGVVYVCDRDRPPAVRY